MKRTFKGKIVSLKTNKTAVIEITGKFPHPLYKKLIKRSKNFKADSGELGLSIGQTVIIEETKPFSKQKFFRVTEVIK